MRRSTFAASKPSFVPFSAFNHRSFAVAAAAAAKPADMFCFQCEQTKEQKGCTDVGVCGKTPEVAALQDLLLQCIIGVSQYASAARRIGTEAKLTIPFRDRTVDDFMLHGMFATVTNVNFDAERIASLIREASTMRDRAMALYASVHRALGKSAPALNGPAQLAFGAGVSTADLTNEGKKYSIPSRQAELGKDYVGLQEMTMYGLKGTAAYAEHARVLGQSDQTVLDEMHDVLAAQSEKTTSIEGLLGNAMKVGAINLKVMGLLDAGGTTSFGHPKPTDVPTQVKEGPAILISGHDLVDLSKVLKKVEGTNINVYTHGEMLPAHAYPGLKHPNLAGHYGGPWQLQKMEFAAFPGPILMTTNCIIEPRKSYKHRMFTRSVVGWPGCKHLENDDQLDELVKAARAEKGFSKEDAAKPSAPIRNTGFARDTVLSAAPKILDLIKQGKITRFFVIGGCDGSEGERSYFTDVAKSTDRKSVV